MALKHPDHEKTFCECFVPCSLCEEYRAQQEGRPHIVIPATREVPKSTTISLPRFTKDLAERNEKSIREILADNSVKDPVSVTEAAMHFDDEEK